MRNMKRVLLSAFACNPTKGSEMGNGWNWANTLARQGYEVHCFTRGVNKEDIEKFDKPAHLTFHFLELPFGLESLYSRSQATMYLHYLLWQWLAYRKGKKLHKERPFDIAHHVSWGSLQMGSFLYRLNTRFIFGPSGGGQKAPEAFKSYFGSHWASEIKREKTSELLLKYNPACRQMLRKASMVIVSNEETREVAVRTGAQHLGSSLDAALPDSFFPPIFNPKVPKKERLNLLWIGRFMPRKGLPLVLEVMKQLKESHPTILLTIVGDGEMGGEVRRLIQDFGLQNTVNLAGKVPFEKVREFYASHDVFFFTSLRDSCPVQLIEAMAYGMPVVTINLHGQGVIVNDQTGIRCKCDTPQTAIQELSRSLQFLYANPEKVTEMSKAAYAFAKEQTWETKVSKTIQLYYLS